MSLLNAPPTLLDPLPRDLAGWANPSGRKVRRSADAFLNRAIILTRFRKDWEAGTLSEEQRARLARSLVVYLRDEARIVAELFRDGQLSERQWRDRMAEITGAGAVAATFALQGHRRISRQDSEELAVAIDGQMHYLGRFVRQVERGDVPKDGRIVSRSLLYATSAWTAAQAAARSRAERTGFAEERNVLGPAEHCPGCLAEASKGWQPIGTLVPIGDRNCRVNCRCRYEFRRRRARQAGAAVVSPPPVPPPVAPPAWPDDPIGGVELVRRLGGSTGAELVRDPRTGRQFVRKAGASPDHLREEVRADALYRALGVPVPEGRLYDTPGGPVKLAEFIEGTTLSEFRRTASPAEVARVEARLREHFVVDAVLGNWDVVGLGEDNILIARDGTPYRIDNGGALRFRAQGGRKAADQWDAYPTELWSLRDPRVNAQTARVFGPITAKEIADQAARLDKAAVGRAATIAGPAGFPGDLRKMVGDRIDQAKDVGRATNTLMADRFRDGYADGFTRHLIGIRKAGIVDRMPTKLDNRGAGVTVYDENGKPWDHLRGPGSLVEDLERYVDGNGGEYAAIKAWASGQAGDSWASIPSSVKYWFAGQRDAPNGTYFWRHGEDAARQRHEDGKARLGDKFDPTFQALHAFTYNYLTKADFPNKDAARGTVRLMRTEDKKIMRLYKLKPGDQDVTMQRGPLESTSIYEQVTVYGSELTVQDVPLHRIFATYWQDRDPGGYSSGMFMGDRENEFLAMLDDIRFEYRK